MTIYFSAMVFIFGLIIGSFLNCLIWRLYKNESLGGRSYCPHCRRPIAWYDNIPLISFIFLRGRCRQCQVAISWQYPLVELITAILFLLVWQRDSVSPDLLVLLLRDWFLIISLVIIFVYDFRWQLVPVALVCLMGGLVFILNLILGYAWFTLIVSALIGGAFFFIQYILTKKRGVGEGDIYLGIFLGLTFPNLVDLVAALLIAYFSGAIVSSFLVFYHRKAWQSRIALGPFLAIGAIITLIWGQEIISWYINLF
ncbi:MAG: prepilin peptidase [Patescibacteria group bacterium]